MRATLNSHHGHIATYTPPPTPFKVRKECTPFVVASCNINNGTSRNALKHAAVANALPPGPSRISLGTKLKRFDEHVMKLITLQNY